jgi:hypothetical protein
MMTSRYGTGDRVRVIRADASNGLVGTIVRLNPRKAGVEYLVRFNGIDEQWFRESDLMAAVEREIPRPNLHVH